MNWKPTSYEDLLCIEVQPAQIRQDVRKYLQDVDPAYLSEFSRALVRGAETLAVFGIWPLWDGVAQAWSLLSEEALKHPFAVARGALRFLREQEADGVYHRIQATVDVEHAEAIHFIEFLGFEREGLLRSYGMNRESHWMYGRLIHGEH